MTITVTPDPTNSPPRNAITVAVAAGSVMSAVSVWRNDASGRSLLRTQPSAGFDSRTIYDYECPYGVSVSYGWSALYTDPTAYTTLWNETWANVSSWAVEYGTWTAVSGKARSGTGGGQLTRTVTPGKYRVTLDSLSNPPSVGGAFAVGVAFYEDAVTVAFSVQRRVGGAIWVTSGLGESVTTIDPALPIIVDINATTVRVWNTGGSFTVARATTISKITLVDLSNTAGMLFGPVKVQAYPAPTAVTETSSPVTLDSTDAWFVHPASPGLSFRLSNTDGSKAGIREIGDVTNASSSTAHSILGSRRPVTTTSGPRADDSTSMVVFLATSADQSAMRALLADDVPILIQFPIAWGNDFACGYYQVGDVSTKRLGPAKAGFPYRDVVLPLQRVQSPVVIVANSGWSYAAVVVDFATYAAQLVSFATYADLASNTRS